MFPYLVDIGYNPPVEQVGTKFALNFRLWLMTSTQSQAEFSDVIVTITQNGSTTVSTKIPRDEYLGSTLLYTPVVSDPLTIHARYENGDITLADASFSLPVAPSGDDAAFPVIFVMSGLLAVIVIVKILVTIFSSLNTRISSKHRNSV